MDKMKNKEKVLIPAGVFYECCADCGWSRPDPGANWPVYCDYKRTHVKANDYCGYYK